MPKFVVQKHDASQLHYDFRLQMGGVLKSWAIPKGPTIDPSVKRLAIEVDDHPISYMHFEGEIPEGQKGAGEVIIWDRGEYETFKEEGSREIKKQYEEGAIHVKLKGKKLKGGFHLIKPDWPGETNKWLFMKSTDEHISYEENILKSKPGSIVSVRRNSDE